MKSAAKSSVHYRSCNLCEAICGVEISVPDDGRLDIRRQRRPVQPGAHLPEGKFFLILGANPAVSNGSLMTAPGMNRRLREIRERGGKVMLVDPRYNETARLARLQWNAGRS